jgi:Zn-dependent protease
VTVVIRVQQKTLQVVPCKTNANVMRYAMPAGKLLGVKIYVHWTFIFLIGWIVISGLEHNLSLDVLLKVFGLVLVVFACIVLHELGHALVARRFGIATRHITLLPIGGIAQMESLPQKPKQEMLIALAGPAVNLVIALIILPFVDAHRLVQAESLSEIHTANFLLALIIINLWLAVFNLIPAFPMDGGRVLRALLAFRVDFAKATRIAALTGQAIAIVFFALGFLYSPTLVFIGLLVFLGGQYEYALVDTLQLLSSYTVRHVLIHEIPTLDNLWTVNQAAAQLLDTQNKNFIVMSNSKPVGTVNRDEIIKAANRNEPGATVDQIKNTTLTYVDPTLPLDEAFRLMRDKQVSILLVNSHNELDGIVDEENIAEFIRLKTAR